VFCPPDDAALRLSSPHGSELLCVPSTGFALLHAKLNALPHTISWNNITAGKMDMSEHRGKVLSDTPEKICIALGATCKK
jgi:hypothetical protein